MKNKQKGSVSTGLIVILGIISTIVIMAIWMIGTYNNLVKQENGIVAVHEDLKNIHTSISNTIKSQGLSVEKYGDMVIEAINASMSGRYGESGSGAAMQWIQEQNPTIDPVVFQKLQVAIEAGYNKFETAQRSKIDKLRVYQNSLDSAITGSLASFFGFPKKVTEDMKKTISSASTEEMMETKKFETINPFGEK